VQCQSYHYFDEDFAGVGQSKGRRVVSVEFYEGAMVDDKTKSCDMSSFSNKTTDVTVYEQLWVVPYGVTALATISTNSASLPKIFRCQEFPDTVFPEKILRS